MSDPILDNKKEQDYLASYDAGEYEHPSVTVDVLVFTTDMEGKLKILLSKRKNFPYQGYWSIPGGFVAMEQSLDDAAVCKLQEKTGVKDIHIEQLYTFGQPGRDPRTRVISVAYIALVPHNMIHAQEISPDAAWFDICYEEGKLHLSRGKVGEPISLAFDHEEIISLAVERLRGKLNYTDIAFGFIKDAKRFAIYELQKIHEAVLGHRVDTPNFRRMFLNLYVKPGRAEETGERCVEYAGRASKYYKLL